MKLSVARTPTMLRGGNGKKISDGSPDELDEEMHRLLEIAQVEAVAA
jgi:hypothetical protein